MSLVNDCRILAKDLAPRLVAIPVLLVTVLLGAFPAAAQLCPPTGTCVISSDVTFSGSMDLGARDLVVAGSATVFTQYFIVFARNITIDGTVDATAGFPGYVRLDATGTLVISSTGRVLADSTDEDNPGIDLSSDGDMTLDGTVSATVAGDGGDGGMIVVASGASCTISGTLDASAPAGAPQDFDPVPAIDIASNVATINGDLIARGGGAVMVSAESGLTFRGSIDLTVGMGESIPGVLLESGGSLLIDSPDAVPIDAELGEGHVVLIATGTVTILRNEIKAGDISVRAGFDDTSLCRVPSDLQDGFFDEDCNRRIGDFRLEGTGQLNVGNAADDGTIDVTACNLVQVGTATLRGAETELDSREIMTLAGTVTSTAAGVTLTYRQAVPDTSGACFRRYGGNCSSSSPAIEQDMDLTPCNCGELVCDDGSACTVDSCDPQSGCVNVPDETLCDDENPCTNDFCTGTGCFHTSSSGSCDDGNQCTVGDTCASGVCVAGPPIDCNDDNPCTTDGCDPLVGCVPVFNTAPCDDDNGCTVGDRCSNGVCQSGAFNPACVSAIMTVLEGACGDGVTDPGEQCDDGNTVDGDCCSTSCQVEPSSVSCDDGNSCTSGDVCQAGACVGLTAPELGCREARRGVIKLVDRSFDTRDRFTWKWLLGPTASTEFGNPVDGLTSYDLCVYDTAGGSPTVAWHASVPGGGMCSGRPCWQAAGGNFRFIDRDGALDGITKILLKSGTTDNAKIVLTGKGAALGLPALPLAQDPAVTVQLKSTDGECWTVPYEEPAVRSDGEQFKDVHKTVP